MGNCFVKCMKRNDVDINERDDNSENSVDDEIKYTLQNTPLDTDDEDKLQKVR